MPKSPCGMRDWRCTEMGEIKADADTTTGNVHDPIHRASYSFERQGENLWVNTWLEDGGHLPEHFHPSLEEHWETLEGAVEVKLDGTWRALRAEDPPVVVPRGMKHELRNTSGSLARLRAEGEPAGRLEEFLAG